MNININIIWFDENYDNKENIKYLNELKEYHNLTITCFKEIEEGIKFIKKIKFVETNIIISGRLYRKFINKFKKKLKEIYIIPKIIIFTKDEKEFLKNNKEYNNNDIHSFYNLGGIKTNFKDIKDFILEPLKGIKREEEGNLTFEYIDCKEKLYYPILYKSLIDTTRIDNIDIFTNKIYDKYKNDSSKIKNLLDSIKSMTNIPIELLSKYYARLYTAESENKQNNFYNNINKHLRENKKDEYLSFIKILYEGIKTQSLSLGSNNILYRGARLKKGEIEIIKNYLNDKKEGLPGAIVFSKTFLSFSKLQEIAEDFLIKQKNDNELNKVLFILEKDNNIDYNLSTHADIEKLSFYPGEKEVLFLPFSSFEIKEIKEINSNNNEKIYEIKLLYLGKYIKALEKNINNDNIVIPDSDFKKQIIENGLIEKNKNRDNPKYILEKYSEYKEEIKKNTNNNYIINQININQNLLNKDIRIINTYEHFLKDNKGDGEKNDKEIRDNIEIRIDDKKIPFSFSHKFDKKGKHIIKYTFDNNLANTNYMFCGCKYLFDSDLSNFNTHSVRNMSYMFYGCESLTNINLSNINTKNNTNMSYMFYGCESLKKIDLSNFDTENVTNMGHIFHGCIFLKDISLSNFITRNVNYMDYMFYECQSLTYINLSSFNTQNVQNMYYMFLGCKSLTSIDLSNFDTQNVKYIDGIFSGCESLKKENVKTKDKKILNEINKIIK